MWDLPSPGLEPVSPALAGRFSTTEPPGKPWNAFLNVEVKKGWSVFLYCLILGSAVQLALGNGIKWKWQCTSFKPRPQLWVFSVVMLSPWGRTCLSHPLVPGGGWEMWRAEPPQTDRGGDKLTHRFMKINHCFLRSWVLGWIIVLLSYYWCNKLTQT